MIPTQTLTRFILAEEREHIGASGELSDLLSALALGVKMISSLVATAGFKGLYGYTGATNVQGESTQKLDLESNQILIEILGSSGHFGLLVSEETDTVLPCRPARSKPGQPPRNEGKYIVAFDPLDGSSNLGSNVPVGTIFSIFKRSSLTVEPSARDFLRSGRELVAAGYSIYGSSTLFVYSAGDGVHEFTLDPTIGEFLLTDSNLKTPKKGTIYSANEGNSVHWDAATNQFIQLLKKSDTSLKTPYSARYVGSLVADFHRNLKKGGIYLYPKDAKNARGKLRLLYECMPMAFIAEQAGGRATDGERDILDIVASDVHERCPLIVGSSDDVELYLKVLQKQ